MDGHRFAWPIHVHGTLAEDIVAHYKMPCPATLVAVITTSVADAHGAMEVGTVADPNGYLVSYVPGHNDTPDVRDRGDFDGALNLNTAECPHIAKDTVLEVTWTHNDANTNVDIQLIFLEG